MLKYVRVQRMISTGAFPGQKYLARLFRSNDVDINQLCAEIVESTTLSYPDVLACLKAFEINIAKHIQNGSAVKFGILGSFIPTIKAKAMNTLEEVDASTIKSASCRFFPSVDFKSSLAKATFVEADLNIKGLQTPDGTTEETPIVP